MLIPRHRLIEAVGYATYILDSAVETVERPIKNNRNAGKHVNIGSEREPLPEYTEEIQYEVK